MLEAVHGLLFMQYFMYFKLEMKRMACHIYCLYYCDIKYGNIILKYDFLCGQWVESPAMWSEFMSLLTQTGDYFSCTVIPSVINVA